MYNLTYLTNNHNGIFKDFVSLPGLCSKDGDFGGVNTLFFFKNSFFPVACPIKLRFCVIQYISASGRLRVVHLLTSSHQIWPPLLKS